MQQLVATLKAQQRAVQKMVSQVDAALAHGDSRAISAALSELKSALRIHLDLEDNQLYPALSEAANKRRRDSVAGLVRTFTDNVSVVSATMHEFLRRWEGAELEMDAFRADWAEFVGVLTKRIDTAETRLYPLYEAWVFPQRK
jgi:hypothetical protein